MKRSQCFVILFWQTPAEQPKVICIDLVDEGTIPPQKLVLRTVRAQYTNLAETSVVSVCCVAKKSGKSVKSVVNFFRALVSSWHPKFSNIFERFQILLNVST
jgi:hypothetical protein